MADQSGERPTARTVPRGARSAGAPPQRPGPPRGLGAVVVTASAAALAVAALCLHAASGSPNAGTGPLTGYWILIALAAGVAGCMFAAKYRVRQEERPGISAREERFTRAAVVGLFAIAACTVVSVIVIGSGRPQGEPPPATPLGIGPSVKPPPPPTFVPPVVKGHASRPVNLMPLLITVVCVLAAVALVLLVGYLVRHVRYLPRAAGIAAVPPSAGAEEVRLAEAVDAGRLALHGDDTRAAVIACYAAMEASLAAGGLGRHAADSPADLLRRAAEAGLLAGPAPDVLADLFREARYSTHPMGPEQLSRARAALDAIGETLRAHQARMEAAAEEWLSGRAGQSGNAGLSGNASETEAVAPR